MPEEEMLPPPPEPPKKKEGFFAKQQPSVDLSGVTADINALGRRIRMLEEGSSNMRRFLQVTEENIIAKNKHYSAETKTLASDITEIRKELQEIREKMGLVIRELQTVARKEEVRVLEKYINLWNPVRFVSQNEVEQIVNEILEKKEREKNSNI